MRPTCVLSGLRKLGWEKKSYSRAVNDVALYNPTITQSVKVREDHREQPSLNADLVMRKLTGKESLARLQCYTEFKLTGETKAQTSS